VRTESRIFYIVAGALFLIAGLYAWATDKLSIVEWAGTVALALAGALCAMCGLYFGFVANRIRPRPEDRGEAEISDGAGDIGFFAPGSYWPFGIGLAAAIAGLGLALMQAWVVVLGLIGVLLATSALTFEFYTGTRHGLD
jgi:hypothetical protein